MLASLNFFSSHFSRDGGAGRRYVDDKAAVDAAVGENQHRVRRRRDDAQPPIGTPLAVGACVGRVVSVLPTGFAVRLIERQKLDDLSRPVMVQPRRGAVSAEDRAA